MSIVQPYNSNELTRDARRSASAISRYQHQGQLRIATTDIDTDVALAKVDAMTAATGSAMGAVIRVAQAQKHLETLAPEASGRLNFLADSHSMALADVMTDLQRDLRRR